MIDLEKVLKTKPGGRSQHDDDHHRNAIAAIARVQDVWRYKGIMPNKRLKPHGYEIPQSSLNGKDMCKAAAEKNGVALFREIT